MFASLLISCVAPSGDLPGHNRCLDSGPADCPYLMSLMLLVALLDFLVARAHLLDCLPIHLRMICGCEALPAGRHELKLLLGMFG